MTGEIAIGGIFVPALLVLGFAALILTLLAGTLINLVGGYRLFLYRPLVDLALFVLILGLLVMLTARGGGVA